MLIFSLLNSYLFKCVDSGSVPVVDIPEGKDIPKNQAKVPRPDKSDAIGHHQSRMNM